MSKNSGSGVARNTVLLTAVSLLGIVLSFVKEAVMAYYFGASEAMDAYVVAVDLPVVLFSLISVAMAIILIPNYVKLRTEEGDKAAQRYFCNLFTILAIVGIGIGLVFEVAADLCVALFAPGLSAEAKSLAVSLFRIVVPATVLLLLIHSTTSVMNAHKCFATPALGEPLLSVIFIGIVMCCMSLWGIYAAAIGTVIGAILQFIYVTCLRRKYVIYRPGIDLKDSHLLRSLRMAVPVLIGALVAELNKLVDKAVASTLSEGSISALHYAAKISSGISNVLINGIFTVSITEFAEKAAQKDDEGMAKAFESPVNGLLLIAIPLFAGGTFLREEIVKLIYGRGAFDAEVMQFTAPLFAGYLCAIFFNAVQMFSTRVFNAYGDTKTPVTCSAFSVAVNVVLNLVLSRFWGALGLVIATVVATAAGAGLLLVLLKRKNPHMRYRRMLYLFVKGGAAAGLMLAALVAVQYLFGAWAAVSGMLLTILYIGVAVVIGAAVYAAGLYVLKVEEFRQILMWVKKKIK